MYEAEGDRRNWPGYKSDAEVQFLRLPEDWHAPQPFTAFQKFLGTGPIHDHPRLHWPGLGGYAWEPRFVAYGSYQLFSFTLRENRQQQVALGHQLLVDLDLQLTGTERFHVQFRPLGRKFTGGSFYQFTDPEGYVSNATGEPDRYWFEAELHSIFGAHLNPFAVRDFHIVAGKFPFQLQNTLLMNDDILGVAINKNTIQIGSLSNLNVQLFVGFDDVDAFDNADGRVYGINAGADWKRDFYEFAYAFVQHQIIPAQDAHYAAFSSTRTFGLRTLAGRALFKWGRHDGEDDGQLFVLESNRTQAYDDSCLGIEQAVFYANAFLATKGWTPIAVGNFNRLTTSFEVSPLVQIAAGRRPGDIWGAAVGVQLFRHHEDESLTPEFACEVPENIPVWGFGMRYQRKTGPRTFLELLGVINVSDDPRFDRDGIFASGTVVF